MVHVDRSAPAHNFHHPAVTTKHLMHRQQDCLVVWPYKVRLLVFKPNAIVEIGSAEVTSKNSPTVKEDKFLLGIHFC